MFNRIRKHVLLFFIFTTIIWARQGAGPLALQSVIQAVPEAAQAYTQWQTFQRGDYLIIGQDEVIASPYIPFFKRFKESQGFRVSVVGLGETGATATEIRAYIQNFYQTHNLEYVLLIGDVTGWAALPSFTIGSENDVTDLPYVLLEGDDYLPEAIVGRWPIDTQTELGVIVNKTMNYSQSPYAGSDWLDRALVVAGNYADTGVILTPVWTSSWLARGLGNFGYTSVDTVYYPPTTTPEQIRNIMNSGVGIVNYRGWGDAHGWHFPQFHVSDFDAVQGSLNNGFRLPVVFSFVCGTGKFDSPIDPSFGEALISRGTVSTPSGAVAVVAPSDLHTRTKYNNALNSIMWDALLEGRVNELGPALTAAKFGFLNEFADQTEPGEMGEFYFHTYNILGDPSLPIWLLTPESMDVTAADFGSVTGDDAVMVLDLPDIPEGVFALKRGDTLIGSGRWENGQVRVYAYDGAAFGTDDLSLTLNAPQKLPVTLDMTPAAGAGIGIAGYDDLVYPGVATLTPVFSNTTTGSVDAQVTLSSLDGVYSENFSVTIPANGTAVANPVTAPVIHIGEREVVLNATINGTTSKIAVPVMPVTASMSIAFAAGHQPNPGETFALGLDAQFQNLPLSGALTATITSTADYLTISQNTSPATIQDGVVVISSNAFEASLSQVASGSKFPLHVALQMDGEPTPFFQQTILIPVGGLTASEPTPPDAFGYWAYDDTDLAYEEAPVYNWTELSTHAGATYYALEDDDHIRVALPFAFSYYGNVYEGLTLSSNGWASFEAESIDFFRNWSIPFPLGPGAMVSPFWDDLDYVDDSGDLMDIYTLYDEAAGKFIVEWHEVRNGFGDHSFKETFQIILYDPATMVADDGQGVIEFQYHEVNDVDQSNNYSTVGIESPDQNDGIQYVYNRIYAPGAAELTAGRAIRFTTNSPADYYSSLMGERQVTPETFLVGNAYPNPFNPVTSIPVAIAAGGELNVTLYNILGQEVQHFSQVYPDAGEYSVVIGSESLASGVYLVSLRVGHEQHIRKITFLK